MSAAAGAGALQLPRVQPLAAVLLDRLTVGLAVADPEDWSVRYTNARFDTWFPSRAAGDTLATRIPGFEPGRAQSRIRRERPYRLETEVQAGPRATPLLVELHRELVDGEQLLAVHVHNITKQREAEYMLDSYSQLMERQARALEQEKERAERLLLNIMPRSVAAELNYFGTTTPHSFPSASVLMLDFVDFTEMAISREPAALIGELNDIFTSFDRIMEHSGGERIKTIGDAYMAVAGVPDPDPDHEFNVAHAALRMRKFIERRNESAAHRWRCRIGLGWGPVIGSVVGLQKYVYDIFGPAVNLAARLEAMAEPMQILVAEELAERIRSDFVLRSLGAFEVKGFGRQQVYTLEAEARKGRR